MTQNTIQKLDANPLVAAILTFFVFGLGHFLINGQQRKWLYTLIAGLVGTVLCCLPGFFIGILSVVDAYQTAERLQGGETIPENEYTLPLLFKIISIVDKEATCSRA
jgi:TM2 domain-containing membrane protein YozV